LRGNWTTTTDSDAAGIISQATGRTISRGNVRDIRRAMGCEKTIYGEPKIFSDSVFARYDNPPVLKADDVLVIGDCHVPYQHAEWCSQVVGQAVKAGIRQVVIAGDLLDFATLSSFTQYPRTDDDADDAAEIADELDAALGFCETLLTKFDNVLMTLGNHEERASRRLAVLLRARVFKRLLGFSRNEKFKVEPYFYSIIQTSDGHQWRATHPKNASVVPVAVAMKLADRYQMHVIAAHGHDVGEAVSATGRYAAACGCCVDPARLDYASLQDSTRPGMRLGAWALVRGVPRLMNEFRPTL
jgi:predicted phosphodiesterase